MMFLLFNMLSRLVIAFLPRSKHLLISWLQSPSAMILEPPPPQKKSDTAYTFSPSICVYRLLSRQTPGEDSSNYTESLVCLGCGLGGSTVNLLRSTQQFISHRDYLDSVHSTLQPPSSSGIDRSWCKSATK